MLIRSHTEIEETDMKRNLLIAGGQLGRRQRLRLGFGAEETY